MTDNTLRATKRRLYQRVYQAAYAKRHPDRVRAASAKYYAANKEKRREYRMAHPERNRAWKVAWRKTHPWNERAGKYGLVPDALAAMMAEQGGKCSICRDVLIPGRLTHVDHKPGEGGAVRGLLCRGCNVGLGQFRDDPTRLTLAAAYLRKERP
jgi:hypothetical protein